MEDFKDLLIIVAGVVLARLIVYYLVVFINYIFC